MALSPPIFIESVNQVAEIELSLLQFGLPHDGVNDRLPDGSSGAMTSRFGTSRSFIATMLSASAAIAAVASASTWSTISQ
ncbi:hypothetical protein Y032_0035g2997 [Ancylostoma ceylanicum]|uniref:Uncharacterized protein n=1 Tax=Ancylostoma ceylanicum TaxID=53326 RepID=A0A016UKU6_9BILA|nr:hypothetical protein Y032_0035g2997 [Ancylostoma ceylanicum]